MDRPIATAEDAARLLAEAFSGVAGEKVVVLHLAADRRLLGRTEHVGDVDAVDLPLRAIIGEALRLDAAGLIVAHNHPSGEASPSAQDLEATRMLAETARRLGIRLVDHLIFAGADCASFRALGLL